jgi:hypothetical protein
MTGWTDEARQASLDARRGNPKDHNANGAVRGQETHQAAARVFSRNNLPKLMRQSNWSILSANRGDAVSSTKNTMHQTQLANDLRRQGASFIKVEGHYGGKPEISYAVTGISARAAYALGAKYKQDSILTNRGLIYTTGAKARAGVRTPSTGRMAVGKSATGDFYSRIPSTGARFSAGLNFDKYKTR